MALRAARTNDAATVPVDTTANSYASVDTIAAPISLRLSPHQLAEDATVPVEAVTAPHQAPVATKATTTAAEDFKLSVEALASPYAPADITTSRFADVKIPSASYYDPVDIKAITAVKDVPVPSETTASPYAVETPAVQYPARLVFDKARVICACTENVKRCQHASGNYEESGSGDASSGYVYVETTTGAIYTRIAADVPSTTTTQVYETATDASTTTTQAETTTLAETITTAADVPSTAQACENNTTTTQAETTTTADDVPSTTTPLKIS
ncbi:hypothetical protein GCK72_026291 [Caenorhabditis remanei]|uniref:Uncharacterized protein n=1 Tax=Caenorhabditis remanei TaxID=31234 RepID=A0A6A5G530_CAERE|nr:hypothetical protein GCK72_026291 [Caenorhabditis remanei]KAF1749822.1 hypothetical protein GCK72_026291 [Caenorhabditis remanei]